MIKFLIDTQLPPALSKYFLSQGYDSIHTTHFENGHLLQDLQIAAIAIDENRIVVTKDNDFLERFILKGAPPKILLLQLGNIKNAELLKFVEKEMNKITEAFGNDAQLVIVSREQLISY